MIGLPLLQRELTELANRKRTYVIRVVSALVLLTLLLLIYDTACRARIAQRGTFNQQLMFGVGGDVFFGFVPLLFVAIKAIMPGLACASISSEKESNTIGTLLLTRLSPGTIVLEKLLSRVVPMLVIIFLTFPLIAYAFALGGVDQSVLFASFWLLLCDCILLASIGLLCSAWFPTTVTAFIWSYIIVGVLVIWGLFSRCASIDPMSIWTSFVGRENYGYLDYYLNNAPDRLGDIMPEYLAAFARLSAVNQFIRSQPISLVYFASAVSLLVSAVCLLLTRLVLIPRAFVGHSSLLLRIFKSIDRFFKRLNDRTTGGIELIPESNVLPTDDPVAWRERSKKSMGQARYLFRILVAIEGPTLFICLSAAVFIRSSPFQGLMILLYMLWALADIVVAVKAATLIPAERSKQTIEPLLASPMSTREILQQKITGMRRLVLVMAIPPVTVSLTQVAMVVRTGSWWGLISSMTDPLIYLGLSLLGGFLMLSIVVWISAGLGLWIQSHTRAAMVAVSLLAVWWTVPFGIAVYLRETGRYSPVTDLIQTLSPFSLITSAQEYLASSVFLFNVGRQLLSEDGPPWFAIPIVRYLIFAVFSASILLAVRKYVSGRASKFLQRGEVESELRFVSQADTNHSQLITEGASA